jgi:NADPH:quinone reductase-like Zn-dependent oxidoreductase
VLSLEQVDVPAPGPGEVRIRIEAFGLNRSEARVREGWHPFKPEFPSRLGYEAAGVIESIGANVEGFAVGDAVSTLPVVTLNQQGAYGELFTVPASAVVHSPPELDMAEAAALWSSYITAYGGLVELISIKTGDFVVVTAASSSLGPPAIQILNMLGAKPIAVTRRRAKADAIAALKPHAVVVTEDEDLLQRLDKITGGAGVNAIFDPIGGPGLAELAKAMAPRGQIVLYGVLDPAETVIPTQMLVSKNLSIHGYAMYLWEQPERTARAIAFIRDGVARGLLRPLVGRRFNLDEIVAAMTFFDSMEQIGKVVVTT